MKVLAIWVSSVMYLLISFARILSIGFQVLLSCVHLLLCRLSSRVLSFQGIYLSLLPPSKKHSLIEHKCTYVCIHSSVPCLTHGAMFKDLQCTDSTKPYTLDREALGLLNPRDWGTNPCNVKKIHA